MADKTLEIPEEIQKKADRFLSKIESNMEFQSDYSGDLLSFQWVSEIESACPYIDIIVRNPKNVLIQEENVLKIEKSKRTNVSSIKNLAKHTEYINKYDPKTEDIEPSKILDIRNEETYNIYENRVLYTIINQLERFVLDQEDLLKDFEVNRHKKLEYASSTVTPTEKVEIAIRVTSESLPTGDVDDSLSEKIEQIRVRIKRIKEFINSWHRSELMKALDHAHIPFVNPPFKKTNLILKNPNFQIAVQLWEYLQKYINPEEEDENDHLEGSPHNVLQGFLDHSFLIDYFVMDSMASLKREQKKNMANASILLLTEEIRRIIELLKSAGMKITDEDLMKMISKELKKDKQERLVGMDDVKKKFQSAMEEYIERTQEYL